MGSFPQICVKLKKLFEKPPPTYGFHVVIQSYIYHRPIDPVGALKNSSALGSRWKFGSRK